MLWYSSPSACSTCRARVYVSLELKVVHQKHSQELAPQMELAACTESSTGGSLGQVCMSGRKTLHAAAGTVPHRPGRSVPCRSQAL